MKTANNSIVVPYAFPLLLSKYSNSFFSGLMFYCCSAFEVENSRLPFRQLSHPDLDNHDNDKESIQHLASKQSIRHLHLEPPELLTTSQDIDVVLGDIAVLPCKVAHLGMCNKKEGIYSLNHVFSQFF